MGWISFFLPFVPCPGVPGIGSRRDGGWDGGFLWVGREGRDGSLGEGERERGRDRGGKLAS